MAENKIKTIGVLTSGGDAPGMNAAIRAVVRRGLSNGLNVKGILKGYNGLLNEEIIDMSAKDVSDTIERGGTILYTARCAEFRTEEGQKRGAEICRKHGIDGLVVIGGDGSFAGAQKLANLGINTIGLPGTIDLDIACTEYTIGFDTAVNTAMEAIDKVRDTSTSHERCSIIEVMGRGAGYIALWCGIANGAEDVLVPEKYDYDEQKLINNIIESRKKGKKHHIIINAEGIGHSEAMAKRIEAATGMGVLELLDNAESVIGAVASEFKAAGQAEVVAKAQSVAKELKAQAREIASLQAQLANGKIKELFENTVTVKGIRYIHAVLKDTASDSLRTLGDQVKADAPDVVAVFAASNEGKASVLAVCGADAVKAGAHAGKLIKEITAQLGGKGGGRPDSAMGGVADLSKAEEVLSGVAGMLEGMLK